MIAYHIDRNSFVKPNTAIERITDYQASSYLKELCEYQFPSGLSMHGKNYLMSDFIFRNDSTKVATIYELIFEYIRVLHFPQMPARFQCYYACEKAYLGKWTDYFKLSSLPIFEVETNNFFAFDARWISNEIYSAKKLDGSLIADWPGSSNDVSTAKIAYQAYQYWSGELTDNPLMELLIVPPFQVLQQVSQN